MHSVDFTSITNKYVVLVIIFIENGAGIIDD